MSAKGQIWRHILKEHLSDPQVLNSAAASAKIDPVTLRRWMDGRYNPRPNNLEPVLAYILERCDLGSRHALYQQLLEDGMDITCQHPSTAITMHDIPSAFYREAINVACSTPSFLLYTTMCDLVLRQALIHLDPSQVGLRITLIHCMPPRPEDGVIRSLQERVAMGRGDGGLEQRYYFHGRDTFAGYALASFPRTASQSFLRFPQSCPEEKSLFACPLLKGSTIGGCVLFSSPQEHFFPSDIQETARRYTNLLTLGMDAHDFYERSRIHLHPMPTPDVQEKLLRTVHVALAQDIDIWLQMETTLLQLKQTPLHPSNG